MDLEDGLFRHDRTEFFESSLTFARHRERLRAASGTASDCKIVVGEQTNKRGLEDGLIEPQKGADRVGLISSDADGAKRKLTEGGYRLLLQYLRADSELPVRER